MQKHVNVENMVTMFRDAGIDDDMMATWHGLFESRYPEGHQSFLEWLGLPSAEIERIRKEYA